MIFDTIFSKKVDFNKLRKDFPLLERKINDKPIIYFDNACMSLRPKQIIEKSNEYYYNYFGIGAGEYQIKVYANNTVGLWNVTDTWSYIVTQASSSVDLKLDAGDSNVSVEAGDYVNVSGIISVPSDGTINLYQDGTLINSGASSIYNNTQFVVPGEYNLSLNYVSTQNHTGDFESLFVTVTDTILPNISLVSPLDLDQLGWNVVLRTFVDDYNLDSVWYEIRNGTETGVVLTTGDMNDIGSNIFNSSFVSNDTWPYVALDGTAINLTFIVYANDSTGNLFSANSTFVLDNTVPSIQFIAPLSTGSYYNSNFSMEVALANHNLNNSYYYINDSTGALVQSGSVNIGLATYTWNDIVNASEMAEGNYTFFVYAEDNSNPANNNSAITWFYVDRTEPSVDEVSAGGWVNPTPVNDSYTSITTQTFNFTCNETFVDSVWIDINGVIDSTPTTSSGIFYAWEVSGLEGTYTYKAYCNDTAGNTQASENRTLFVDVSEPAWSNNNSEPESGLAYVPGQSYMFNVTWEDNYEISSVIIEHDLSGVLTNYSVDGNSG